MKSSQNALTALMFCLLLKIDEKRIKTFWLLAFRSHSYINFQSFRDRFSWPELGFWTLNELLNAGNNPEPRETPKTEMFHMTRLLEFTYMPNITFSKGFKGALIQSLQKVVNF